MSDIQNPWESPATDIEKPPESKESATGETITDTMRRYLGEASPWLRFLGVMSFIGMGFMALAGLIMLIVGLIAGSGSGMETGVALAMGAIYLISAVVIFFPARFTWNFGTKIRAWKENGNSPDLEEALKNNKSLWKFSGIITIIYLAIIPVFMIIALTAGVLTSFL